MKKKIALVKGIAGQDSVVLLGLPSAALKLLVSQLDVRYRELPEFRQAWDGVSYEDGTLSDHWVSSRLAECVRGVKRGAVLLVYASPAAFLSELLKRMAEAPVAREDLEPLVTKSLEFWHAYHVALLEQYRLNENRALLISADHGIPLEALLSIMAQRFGPRHVPKRTVSVQAEDFPAAAHRESCFQIVDSLAPECLELYSELESCAELMGREPEFEFESPAQRQAQGRELLLLLAERARVAGVLAHAEASSNESRESNDVAEQYLRELSASQDQIRTLQEQLRQLNTRVSAYEAERTALQSENESLRLQPHPVKAEVEQLVLARNEQTRLATERQAQIEQLTKARDEQTEREADLKARLDQLAKVRHEEATQERAERARLVAERDAEIARIASERDQAQLLSRQLTSKIATAETEGKALQSENELMLLQRHQVQEELERYYLLYKQSEQLHSETRIQADEASASLGQGPGENGGDVENTGPNSAGSILRAAGALLGLAIRRESSLRQHAKLLRQSGYFDEGWYLEQYPEVARAGLDPAEHYLKVGASEGRNPGPKFDTRWYLERYPDVEAAKMNPLLHYVKHGRDEGRQPMRFRL